MLRRLRAVDRWADEGHPVPVWLMLYAFCLVLAYGMVSVFDAPNDGGLWLIMTAPPTGTLAGRRLRRRRRARDAG